MCCHRMLRAWQKGTELPPAQAAPAPAPHAALPRCDADSRKPLHVLAEEVQGALMTIPEASRLPERFHNPRLRVASDSPSLPIQLDPNKPCPSICAFGRSDVTGQSTSREDCHAAAFKMKAKHKNPTLKSHIESHVSAQGMQSRSDLETVNLIQWMLTAAVFDLHSGSGQAVLVKLSL